METPTADPGGVLLVDKPAGVTSHDVVALVRRCLHTRRVGHTGTLDPFATGLLVVLVGRGTRLIPYVEGEPKIYEATIRFGAETDTDDLTGTTTVTAGQPTDAAIAEGVARLTGTLDQVPPAYSAKQVGGTRAYDAARRGDALELAPARVVVHEWTLLGRDGADLKARITCGGGTYVRALARDLGRLAGSAAHLAELRRTAAGPFTVTGAVTVDALRAGTVVPRPLRAAVPSLPVRTLSDDDLRRVVHGNSIAGLLDAPRTALIDSAGELVAVADAVDGELRPKLVLRDA